MTAYLRELQDKANRAAERHAKAVKASQATAEALIAANRAVADYEARLALTRREIPDYERDAIARLTK